MWPTLVSLLSIHSQPKSFETKAWLLLLFLFLLLLTCMEEIWVNIRPKFFDCQSKITKYVQVSINDLKHKIQSFTCNLVDNAIVSYHNSGYKNDEERTIPTNETPLFPTKHFTTKTTTIRIMIYASCIAIISSKFEALACLQQSHLKSEMCKY